MKANLLSLALLSLIVGCSSQPTSNDSTGGHAVAETKSSYHLPAFEEKVLDNGLRILFIPDDKLPYVSFSVLVRAGSSQDPQGQGGLADMVAELLDKGTVKKSATQIAQDLGNMGADFDASASHDYTELSASGLSNQAEALLENFSEIVMQPAFSDSEIERVRKQAIAQIQRRVDNPEAYADLAFSHMVFGEHPYGRPISGSKDSVEGIKKKAIIQYYLHHYRPNNAIMAVVGKYTPELRANIEKSFGTWQKRDVPAFTYPPVEPVHGLQMRLVNKSDLVQAQIRFGYPGIKRKNDDFLAIRIANTILGGAFASRLNTRIRKQLGLTYTINSGFDAEVDAGAFEIETFTKTSSIGQTVSETLKVLGEFRDKGVTPEEVDRAKGYMKGVFPTAIETPEKLAFNLLLLRFYGIPDTYLTNYLHDVDELTKADVNRVIEKYFDAKNIKVLIYANASEAKEQLKPLAVTPSELVVEEAETE